ncbi:hypothetical protein PPL_04537 [Heterostelium album PN500]|uniref:Uncharacterized protein n=1 Tax=Heterostelium pallidum (strain ATCC 26659 / Pp 5 / PN500) TaxID=670386 RepID=D3B7U9_HETP5|nr:hypothetical protein PPL_04537 [Heterostelium album PN500]EFA82842.1 hypothetical protein PPL_04537 [Heterostelium album PN500]|eukprot:XP_020434959.1 hypothetical protein PPL_04537 [Heterostelium album PN500]
MILLPLSIHTKNVIFLDFICIFNQENSPIKVYAYNFININFIYFFIIFRMSLILCSTYQIILYAYDKLFWWSSYYIDSATIFKNKIEDWQSERYQLISTIQGIDRNSRSHIIFEKLIDLFITLINMSVPVFFDLSE